MYKLTPSRPVIAHALVHCMDAPSNTRSDTNEACETQKRDSRVPAHLLSCLPLHQAVTEQQMYVAGLRTDREVMTYTKQQAKQVKTGSPRR